MTTLATLPRLPVHRHDAAANPQHLPKDVGVATPLTSPLAILWFGGQKFERRHVPRIAIAYVAGMVGYAFSLVWRVCAFVYRVFKLIGTLIGCAAGCCSPEDVKYTAWKTLRRFLEIFSATAGIVCPPAGYFLDRQIDRLADQHEEKGYLLYHESGLTEALEIIGFDRNASPSPTEINDAYHAKARQCHSDKQKGDDDSEMQKLNGAKEVLDNANLTGPLASLRFKLLEFIETTEFV